MYHVNRSFGAAASSTQASSQSQAGEAQFAAEVARVAALADTVNKWGEAAKASGKFSMQVASDGLAEVPSAVRSALIELLSDGELAMKVSSGPTPGNPAPVIGVSDANGDFKFKVSDIIAGSKSFVLVSDKYLGDAQKLGFLISSDASDLAKYAQPGAGYGILHAPAALRATASSMLGKPAPKYESSKSASMYKSKGGKDIYLGFKFDSPALETANRAGQIVVGTAAIYHGYKRNESIGWALVWGILGTAFWPIAAPVMLAQGFGQPKKK